MKVAIITGATSGMGYEAALQMDKQFASLDEIWLIGRREDRLAELQEKLSCATRTFTMDLTDPAEWVAFEQYLAETHPNIRMLFNAAGAGLHGKFADMKRQEETQMVRLNCEALTAITGICIPYMKKNSYIIQIASSAGFVPFPEYSVYAASKAYVLSLSRALRFELKERGIYVTAVCPGPVNTEFFDISERYSGGISETKKKFMNTPQKVVKKALFDAYLKRPISVDTCLIGAFRGVTKIVPTECIMSVANRIAKI